MTVSTIAALLGAFAATLTAEEAVLAVAMPEAAQGLRATIEAIRNATREAIEAAVAAPGDAFERMALLRHAVDLEGFDGPLVARIAASLAAASQMGSPTV
ncbi:hypothetical protein GOFOIKOB_4886 [Methylobacterium tardum]|uniref:Uncharacterized protein n=1 Tax=Methylobacterium tardum TaxID=374432 RepID=A0AA37THP8_9HYPH|nr:hypothetical protein [Methylobacterium tardum]URD35817.1 hypothetical protein M6G65_25725 [Methylobacterium tardum]GJE51822.1 hypothetical protein GOFOIKOB_4886 [Methylobacterium tardum]GLS72322.1 hypothetical protein GCM10007890_43350 [Methylobacterium tardum]